MIKLKFSKFFPYRRNNILSVYFGVPGSGKTTFAAYLAKADMRHGLKVWSNVPIVGTYRLEPKVDLGHFQVADGRVIIDECGLAYNNRNFKANFSPEELEFFKLHRHYDTAIDIFSQGYDDMDKKLRTLAQVVYLVKKSLIPFFIYRRTILKKVGINETTNQIEDQYFFKPFSRKYIFSPLLWSLFDTTDRVDYPDKEWVKW